MTQPSLAKRFVRDSVAIGHNKPVATEMSNEPGGVPRTSGAFPGAHDFIIKDSTLNDVKGNYVSSHFVPCDDIIVTDYMSSTTTRLPRPRMDLHLYIEH